MTSLSTPPGLPQPFKTALNLARKRRFGADIGVVCAARPWFLRIFGLFLAPALGLIVCTGLGALEREKTAKNMLFVSLCLSSLMVFIAGTHS
eukprot:3090334-Rhodomonas_salina.2